MKPQSRVPITVITGFLGSGKTSLLNHIIHHNQSEQLAVIINEWGDEPLDHLLVESVDEELVLLENGCVCCTVRSDLVESLFRLVERRDRGDIPAFQRVVIETTGMADPAPVMHAIMTEEALTPHYYFDALITTVDALEADTTLDEYPESRKQVSLADRLVITKSSLLPRGFTTDSLVKKLGTMNRVADILHAGDDLKPEQILNTGLYDEDKNKAAVNRWLTDLAYQPEHDGVHHDREIKTFTVVHEASISRAVLGMWLSELVRDHGNELLRLKGMVRVDDTTGPVIIHGVQHRFYPPVSLAEWPDENDHTSRIVFIVKNLEKSTVVALLEQIEQRFSQ